MTKQVVHEFMFEGAVMERPAWVSIYVNDIEVFSGEIEVNDEEFQQELELLDGIIYLHAEPQKSVYITIVVNSGIVKFGPVFAYDLLGPIRPYNKDNDGRTNIQINGVAPDLTSEAEDWRGWMFELAAGDAISFDYEVWPFAAPKPVLYSQSPRMPPPWTDE